MSRRERGRDKQKEKVGVEARRVGISAQIVSFQPNLVVIIAIQIDRQGKTRQDKTRQDKTRQDEMK